MQIAMTMAKATASTKPMMLLKVTFSIESVPLKVRRPAKDYAGEMAARQSGQAAHLAGRLTTVACRTGRFVVRSGPTEAPGSPAPMAFEDLKAELALLINQMENQPEDPHELYLQIREKLNEMRAFGMPLPEDLVEFERDLEEQFAATKRAAKKD